MAAVSILGSGQILATDVFWARSPRARMKGLLGLPPLTAGQALVIEPAAQVHTFGMSYAIDVILCDRQTVVLHVARRVAPWRVTRWVRRARYAIELPAGTVPMTMERGQVLSIDLSSEPRRDR